MTILLQSRQTLQFVRSDAEMTRDEREATHFDSGTEALNFCYTHRLPDMQILGFDAERVQRFVLPVADNRIE